MSKKIKFTVERELDKLFIGEAILDGEKSNYYAYKVKSTVNGEVLSIIEGVCSEKLLEEFDKYHYKVKEDFTIYKENILENYLKETYGSFDYSLYTIEKPYSYIQEHNLENIAFLYINHYDGHLYMPNGIVLNRAIGFDYIEKGVTNAEYDLRYAFEVLKKHPNVKILEEKIQHIPYYNVDEVEVANGLYVTRDEFIKFRYIPTIEESIYLATLKDSWSKRKYILDELLKLEKKNYK